MPGTFPLNIIYVQFESFWLKPARLDFKCYQNFAGYFNVHVNNVTNYDLHFELKAVIFIIVCTVSFEIIQFQLINHN